MQTEFTVMVPLSEEDIVSLLATSPFELDLSKLDDPAYVRRQIHRRIRSVTWAATEVLTNPVREDAIRQAMGVPA